VHDAAKVADGEQAPRASQRLARALHDDVERITWRSVTRMRQELPSYAEVPGDALFPVTLTNTSNLLKALCLPDADHESADRHFHHSGEQRLSQGVTADEMLQAWRIGLEVVREEAHPVAERLEISDADLLEFVEATLRWGDLGMRVSAAAHREGEIRELERLATEQSALRRVAMLAARQAPPEQVFTLVTEEVSQLLDVISVRMLRYRADGTATVVAAWGAGADQTQPGFTMEPPRGTVVERVLRTGGPARVDGYAQLRGPIGGLMRAEGAISAAGGPILVDGRPWGAIVVSSRTELPPDTEDRVTRFAELVSASISNVESRAALERLAAEQSALARVATLVAKEHSPYDLFASLAEELGLLLDVDSSAILRYETDASVTVVAGWTDGSATLPLGERLPLAGSNLAAEVFRTGAPQRKERYEGAPGPIAAAVREQGFRSAVASPIMVEGTTWGVIAVLSHHVEPLPGDTEARLTEFTRHAAMAVANAKNRADLAQSRERIVRAADEARRRLERDLHDGAQQRLVSLGLQLRSAETSVEPERDDLRQVLMRVGAGLNEILDELRELCHGLHPAVLSEGGLTPALRMLARRSAVPVTLRVEAGADRFEQPLEATAYYVAAEALTNTAKHAHATGVEMSAVRRDGWLELVVSDDGIGGADASDGTGLTGLVDRVEAIGGTIRIDSPPTRGTVIHVRLPITQTSR
jgi:signal transduction histidine kinase